MIAVWRWPVACLVVLVLAYFLGHGLELGAATQAGSRGDATPASAQDKFDTGMRAILARDFAAALQAFDEAVRLDPDLTKAHDGRGVALALLNRKADAEKAFRLAIRLDDHFVEPHFNLGKLLLELDRSVEARDELQRAVSLDPRHLPSIELLLDCMLSMRD